MVRTGSQWHRGPSLGWSTVVDKPDLVGTWRVVAVGADEVGEDIEAELIFASDGRAGGRGGVNRIGGTYELEAGTVVLGTFWSTKMAGPPAAMAVEQRVLRALAPGPHALTIEADTAVMGTGDDALGLQRVVERAVDRVQ
jgi:heat shock protein HslJ